MRECRRCPPATVGALSRGYGSGGNPQEGGNNFFLYFEKARSEGGRHSNFPFHAVHLKSPTYVTHARVRERYNNLPRGWAKSIAKRVGSEPNASRYDKGENYEQCLVTSRLRLHNSTVGISCQGVFVKNFKKISKPRKKVHKSGNQNIKESLKMSVL